VEDDVVQRWVDVLGDEQVEKRPDRAARVVHAEALVEPEALHLQTPDPEREAEECHGDGEEPEGEDLVAGRAGSRFAPALLAGSTTPSRSDRLPISTPRVSQMPSSLRTALRDDPPSGC
jgi:hypothetical protein